MARGNQREQDRLKAQKKAAAASKGKSSKQSGTSLAQKREQDAEIVKQKMAAKAARAAEGGDEANKKKGK